LLNAIALPLSPKRCSKYICRIYFETGMRKRLIFAKRKRNQKKSTASAFIFFSRTETKYNSSFIDSSTYKKWSWKICLHFA